MKKIRYILIMMMCTSILWYLITSFVYWDITWASGISEYSNEDRFGLLLCIFLKIFIDAAIWDIGIHKMLKEEGKL